MASIPPDLEPLVLQQAGKGLTTRQIASWLKSSHSIDTTYKTVAKLLARTRTARADVAKVVLREKLGSSLTTDIDRLEMLAAEAVIRAGKCLDDEVWCKLAEQVRKITDTKLQYSGAGQDDNQIQGIDPASVEFDRVMREKYGTETRIFIDTVGDKIEQ